MREALRIGLLAVAVTLASARAGGEDGAASFGERWHPSMSSRVYPAPEFVCGGVKMLHNEKLPAGDDEKTHLRKQRARIRAILNSDP